MRFHISLFVPVSSCFTIHYPMTYNYTITIHHLYISSGHNYFTHPYDDPGEHPITDLAQVEVHAGQGLVGDRFYGRGPNFDGHVTFFSWEVYCELVTVHGLPLTSPTPLRRNVVIEDVPLNQLIGHPFTINGVEFFGAKHCSPCRWMDIGGTTGTLQQLKGRGGLRAQAHSDGYLDRGTTTLTSEAVLDLTTITGRLTRPKLP